MLLTNNAMQPTLVPHAADGRRYVLRITMKLQSFQYDGSVEQLREVQEYAKRAELEDASLKEIKAFYRVFLQYFADIPRSHGEQFLDWQCSNERLKFLVKEKSNHDPLTVSLITALITFALTIAAQYINHEYF